MHEIRPAVVAKLVTVLHVLAGKPGSRMGDVDLRAVVLRLLLDQVVHVADRVVPADEIPPVPARVRLVQGHGQLEPVGHDHIGADPVPQIGAEEACVRLDVEQQVALVGGKPGLVGLVDSLAGRSAAAFGRQAGCDGLAISGGRHRAEVNGNLPVGDVETLGVPGSEDAAGREVRDRLLRLAVSERAEEEAQPERHEQVQRPAVDDALAAELAVRVHGLPLDGLQVLERPGSSSSDRRRGRSASPAGSSPAAECRYPASGSRRPPFPSRRCVRRRHRYRRSATRGSPRIHRVRGRTASEPPC